MRMSVTMLEKRKTTHVLLLINLVLVLFIIIRSGSESVEPRARAAVPLTVRILDQPPPARPDTLMLNDFEKANDRMNMYDQGGEYSLELSSLHATHGKSSLLLIKEPSSNMELATVHFPRQWNLYDALELDVFNASDIAGTLWIRVGSQFDARRFYVKSQKFSRAFVLGPGANTIVIPVADIAAAFGRLPQRKSLHFNFTAGDGGRYFLDYLRMVSHDR